MFSLDSRLLIACVFSWFCDLAYFDYSYKYFLTFLALILVPSSSKLRSGLMSVYGMASFHLDRDLEVVFV